MNIMRLGHEDRAEAMNIWDKLRIIDNSPFQCYIAPIKYIYLPLHKFEIDNLY